MQSKEPYPGKIRPHRLVVEFPHCGEAIQASDLMSLEGELEASWSRNV